MKKFKLFQILPLFAAILLVGCDRVEPGNVGIKVNKLGDDKGVGEVVGVGRYWTGWNTNGTLPQYMTSNTAVPFVPVK